MKKISKKLKRFLKLNGGLLGTDQFSHPFKNYCTWESLGVSPEVAEETTIDKCKQKFSSRLNFDEPPKFSYSCGPIKVYFTLGDRSKLIGIMNDNTSKEVSTMSRAPEKWRDLAIAKCIDGAEIQFKTSEGNWLPASTPCWGDDSFEFRIDPKCDYALAKIPEKHREVYLQWCDGAEIEALLNGSWGSHSWGLNGNKWMECFDLRVKPKTVKRYQWLVQEKNGYFFVTGGFLSKADLVISLRQDLKIIRPIEETMREDEA